MSGDMKTRLQMWNELGLPKRIIHLVIFWVLFTLRWQNGSLVYKNICSYLKDIRQRPAYDRSLTYMLLNKTMRINLEISSSRQLEIVFGIMFLLDFIHNLFINTDFMTFIV